MSKSVKFLDFLKQQDPDTMIYFGTKNGSSWLAIETAQTLIDNIDDMEKKLHRRSVDILRNAKEKLAVIPGKLVEAHEKLNELEASGDASKSDIAKAKTKVSELEKKFVAAFSTRKNYQNYIEFWIKLPERKVVESYSHTFDIPGVSVVIEGIENGGLWTKYEKGATSLIDE